MTIEEKELIEKHHKELLDTVVAHKNEQKTSQGAFEETVQSKLDKLNGRLDELEIKHLRPATQVATETAEAETAKKEQRDAYDAFLRKGHDRITSKQYETLSKSYGALHTKLLTESDATTGGFFVIPEYEQAITKAVVLISPIRQYARTRTTSSDMVKVPKRTSYFSATWTAEAAQQNEATGLKYGLDQVFNYEMTAYQDISNVDMEDSMFDMASELNSEFSEQFAKAEGAAFVNGSGVGQPSGFMNNAAIASDVTGDAANLTYAGFVNCAHNLKSFYAANAVWFLNRQSIGKVRLLVDSQNRPLWLPFAQSGLSGANAPTILGMPYAEIPDMPNVSGNAYPVALGDWKRGYMIVDRIGIAVMRDPYTMARQSTVRFLARKRVGGEVVLAESIRKIKIST